MFLHFPGKTAGKEGRELLSVLLICHIHRLLKYEVSINSFWIYDSRQVIVLKILKIQLGGNTVMESVSL